jgi:hypothetical protein
MQFSNFSFSGLTFKDVPQPLPPANVEYFVVAGGGSGGGKRTAGGGAGGLIYYGALSTPKTPNGNALPFIRGITYTVTVSGVAGADSSGSNSSVIGGVINLVANGGGRYNVSGGSGGGASAAGIAGQGNAGGPNSSGYGGGGGAGAVGGSAVGNAGGDGGAGLQYSEFAVLPSFAANGYPTGNVTGGWFAGGGGGGAQVGTSIGGAGGRGGGGAGGYGPYVAAYGSDGLWGNPGVINSGSGGGGTSDLHPVNGGASKGFGASGIVIIAYDGRQTNGAAPQAWATGGTIDTTTRPGWYLHVFTGSGTFTTI